METSADEANTAFVDSAINGEGNPFVPTTATDRLDQIRTEVLTENTAQAVLKHLNALESNRLGMQSRWIWELLQNARDSAANSKQELVTSICRDEEGLTFRHNGASFRTPEIAHLIYHGSTKVEDPETIGKYGSGFLTTHLLSPAIEVSGQIDNGAEFRFCINRKLGTVQELKDSMDSAWDDFKSGSVNARLPDGFSTQFRYPVDQNMDPAMGAVKDGLAALKRCAPLVVAFNQEFLRIEVSVFGEITIFETSETVDLGVDGLRLVTVHETEGDTRRDHTYVVAQGGSTEVAVPIDASDNEQTCLPVGEIPRLFLGFPLIGTERFSFPGVINSQLFTPTENRDGLWLGQGDDDANRGNQEVFEEACSLLVQIMLHTTSSRTRNGYLLAQIPPIVEQYWLNAEWLRDCLAQRFVSEVRRASVMISECGQQCPQESVLPFAEDGSKVVELWGLTREVTDLRSKLPLICEASGWSDAVGSWAEISETDVTQFGEVIDGAGVTSFLEKWIEATRENHTAIRVVQDMLENGDNSVVWLDKLYRFLKTNGFEDLIRTKAIILNQNGNFGTLSGLHRDQGIDEELKEIGDRLGWPLKDSLRDIRFSSLENEPGAGSMGNDAVVIELKSRLLRRGDENPDEKFAYASKTLFRWIVNNESWEALRGFPVFAKTEESGAYEVIGLEPGVDNSVRPIAPVASWQEDLRQFSEIFPRRHIVSDSFFDAAPDIAVWQRLNQFGFLRSNVIITSSDDFCHDFLPDEPLTEDAHRSNEPVIMTDVAFMTRDNVGIMARVRQNTRLAKLFWRFLTEWLIVHDRRGLEIEKTSCTCGDYNEHHYYVARWLTPLVRNIWVPVGNRRSDRATPRSLAGLCDSSSAGTNSFSDGPEIRQLLDAMRIRVSEFVLETVGSDDPKVVAALEDKVSDMLLRANGSVDQMSHALDYLGDLEDDEELPNVLAERRKRRQLVHENQMLGDVVEKLVKENFERDGFTVERTGIGSDFEIEFNDVLKLKLQKSGSTWLVEVKATRDSKVRMTPKQAETAVENGERFLLCIVPVHDETEGLVAEEVRSNMRFVTEVGSRVDRLCDNLDGFRDIRDDITSDGETGFQLEVEAGSARISVSDAVWEREGVRLEELVTRLSPG